MVFNIQIVFSTNYSLISNGVLNLSGFVTFPDYYIYGQDVYVNNRVFV